jgi:hypothetical protein
VTDQRSERYEDGSLMMYSTAELLVGWPGPRYTAVLQSVSVVGSSRHGIHRATQRPRQMPQSSEKVLVGEYLTCFF